MLRQVNQGVRVGRQAGEVTVLVHGIWMQGVMLRILGKNLERFGFRTHSVSYDFLRQSPEENARSLFDDIGLLGARQVNLVGHSLGGIVILHLLHQYPELAVGKVVLIGSPVHGSSVATRMHKTPALRLLLGRSVEKGLLGGAPAFQSDIPLGIITGKGKMGITALLYPTGEDSDGVVRECETWINEAADRISVPRSHSALIYSSRCAHYIARFLQTGRFRG